jgi:hypothetical protein
MKVKLRSLVVGAAALAVAGLSAMAGGSAALAAGGGGPTPPWESTITAGTLLGGITFYNAEGQVVTGGSITAAGFATYAVASTADPRTGDTKAGLYIYTPVNGVNPGAWSGESFTSATTYPATGAPAPISGTSNPYETNSGSDPAITSWLENTPNTDTSTTDGYAGLYDVRLRASGTGIGIEADYWDTVISVDVTATNSSGDPTAGTWSVDYPDYTQETTTTLTASPQTQTATTPSPVTLTATVSPAADAAGTVTFWTGYGTSSATEVGTAGTVSSTAAIVTTTTTPPADATTTYTAVYTPAIPSGATVTSYDIGSTGSVNVTAQPPLDGTATTLSETGGGGAAGTPVTFTGTVTDTTLSAPVTSGTISLYDNGSTTPLVTTAVSSTGTYSVAYTFAGAGSHSVVATFSGNSATDGSSSSPVTFSETAPQCTTCTNVATIEGTVPEGTLAIYTPFTASAPLNLGTLALNAAGTYYSASAPLDSTSTDVPTAGAIPDPTFNGITVVDTQAGNLPWNITALASALSDGGTNPGSTISGENVGLTNLTAVPVSGNALTASDLTFTNQPAASPPVSPTDAGSLGLGGAAAHTIVVDANQADGTIGINGTVTLNAPTSTEAGLFVGTITFTIAS